MQLNKPYSIIGQIERLEALAYNVNLVMDHWVKCEYAHGKDPTLKIAKVLVDLDLVNPDIVDPEHLDELISNLEYIDEHLPVEEVYNE